MDLTWVSVGVNERALDSNGKVVVAVDPRCYRPTEVATLLGDPRRAAQILGWKPKVGFLEMISEMISHDLELANREKHLKPNGFHVPQSCEV